ncbi:MAG: hypothetical protein WCA96_02515 [Methylocella sp.]
MKRLPPPNFYKNQARPDTNSAELEWNVPPMSAGAMLAANPKKKNRKVI